MHQLKEQNNKNSKEERKRSDDGGKFRIEIISLRPTNNEWKKKRKKPFQFSLITVRRKCDLEEKIK